MSTTAPARQAAAPIESHVWRISAVIVIGSIMSILDTTIVNVALETLSQQMHASIDSVQWVITGYMLSLAAVITVSGWAARRFGAKNVYLLSLICFTAGSALCGISSSMPELIIFRVIQGFGGGMIMPVGQMMMAGAAGPKNMGRVMAITSIPMLLAPILGPTIGGVIVQDLNWHWIFFVNVPIGIIGVFLGMRLLPGSKGVKTDSLDLRGLGLLGIGLPLLTYGLAEIGSVNTFDSSQVIVPCVLGVLLVLAFIPHARRFERLGRRPLLRISLYRRPSFSAASILMFCVGAGLFGAMILLPLYWQTVRGESVIDTGLLTAPQGLGMVIVMPFLGRLVDKHGGGWFALFGIVLTSVATIPLAFVSPTTPIALLFITMMIRGAGIGLAFMPTMTAAYAVLTKSELSDASPQLNVVQRVGGSIGTAILSVVLQRGLDHAATRPAADRLHAAASAFGTSFWWSCGLVAIALGPAVVLLVTERRARAARHGSEHEHEALDAGAIAEAMA